MSTAYNEMIALLEQYIDQPDMAPVLSGINAYCRAAVLAERERCAQVAERYTMAVAAAAAIRAGGALDQPIIELL